MRKKVLLVMTLLWIIFIFFNSLQPGNVSSEYSGSVVLAIYNLFTWIGIEVDVSILSLWIRKLAHVFEFLILGILMTFNFIEAKFSDKHIIIYSFLICLLVAIIDEVIQTFVEGRHGSMTDVLIDAIGITFGVGLVVMFYIINNKRKEL